MGSFRGVDVFNAARYNELMEEARRHESEMMREYCSTHGITIPAEYREIETPGALPDPPSLNEEAKRIGE